MKTSLVLGLIFVNEKSYTNPFIYRLSFILHCFAD